MNDASVDLTASRFDAGIRIGEFIDRDMLPVRLTPDFRWSVVSSPSCFAERGRPDRPTNRLQIPLMPPRRSAMMSSTITV